jgi:hypothetical protein
MQSGTYRPCAGRFAVQLHTATQSQQRIQMQQLTPNWTIWRSFFTRASLLRA